MDASISALFQFFARPSLPVSSAAVLDDLPKEAKCGVAGAKVCMRCFHVIQAVLWSPRSHATCCQHHHNLFDGCKGIPCCFRFFITRGLEFLCVPEAMCVFSHRSSEQRETRVFQRGSGL